MTEQNPGGWPDAARPGVPANPERDGWHWLHHRIESQPQPVQWVAEIDAWASGAAYSPDGVVELGWRYRGPCLLTDATTDFSEGYRAGYQDAYRACLAVVERALESGRSIRVALREVAP